VGVEIAADAAGAVALVRAFTQDIRSHGMGDRVATVRLKTSLKDLDVFVDLAVLDQKIGGLDASQLKGRDAVAVAAFKRAMARPKSRQTRRHLGARRRRLVLLCHIRRVFRERLPSTFEASAEKVDKIFGIAVAAREVVHEHHLHISG
jgi:hypothetical protein